MWTVCSRSSARHLRLTSVFHAQYSVSSRCLPNIRLRSTSPIVVTSSFSSRLVTSSKTPENGADVSATRLSLAESFVSAFPTKVQPYLRLARLDKPIGTWLLLWPCCWSLGLAASSPVPDVKLMAACAIGAVIMRSAGCTINDLWDRDLDQKVERTRVRPIASGEVSPQNAIKFLGVQLLAGLGVLSTFNTYTIALGASSLGLVVAYPLMKRIMGWPQLVLGLTYNWGALIGWPAVYGTAYWPATVPLYLAGVSWTLVYDSIYAHQDRTDDILVGIKSTALTWGAHNKHFMTFFSASSIACFGAAGYMVDLAYPFYGGLALAAAHLAWQVKTVNLNNVKDCHAKFVSNKWFGAIMFASICAGQI